MSKNKLIKLCILILFFPISAPVFVILRKGMKKRWKVALLSTWLVFAFIFVGIASVEPTPSKPAQQAVKGETETIQPAVQVSTAPLTPAEKVASVKIREKDPEKYKSELKNETARLVVDIEDMFFYDDKHQLEELLSDLIRYGRAVKDIETVNIIEVDYETKLIDKFGNDSKGSLMWVSMPVREFSKYNFDNLKYSNIYDKIKGDAIIMILPSSRNKIDFSKVKVSDF